MDKAQQEPTVKAKQLLVDAINSGDLGVAKWWLERKEPQEFALNRKVEPEPVPPEPENQLKDLTDEQLISLDEELSYLRANS